MMFNSSILVLVAFSMVLLAMPVLAQISIEPEPILLPEPDRIVTDYSKVEATNLIALQKFSSNKVELFLGGTEYQAGQNGTVFLQLLDVNRMAINNSLCRLTMWNPSKTLFLNDIQMSYLLNSAGLYYFDFVVPNATGVYMLSARCNFYYNMTYLTSSKDSYVQATANATNFGNINYTVAGYASISAFHSYVQFNLSNFTTQATAVYLYLYEQGVLGYPYVKLQRVTSSWNESNITWINQPSVNDTIISGTQMAGIGWYAWNITDVYNRWVNGTYSNYGLLLNASPYGGTWNFSSFTAREANNDYVPRLMIFYTASGNINEIRGGGEVHVSESSESMAEKVWLQFLTLGTPPLLGHVSLSCLDNMTLLKDNTFMITGPGGDKSYTKSEQEYCPYGCDPKNNQCVPPPVDRAGFIALAVVGVIGFIVVVRRFM